MSLRIPGFRVYDEDNEFNCYDAFTNPFRSGQRQMIKNMQVIAYR